MSSPHRIASLIVFAVGLCGISARAEAPIERPAPAANPPSAIDLFAPAAPPPPTIAAKKSAHSEPSPIIYPAQRLPIHFSHKEHLRRGAVCLSCHALAQSSDRARDSLLPTEAVCATCHAIDHQQPFSPSASSSPLPSPSPSGACATCHAGFPKQPAADVPPPGPALESFVARVEIPTANLKFNHALHVAEKIDCARCHGDLSQVDLATRAQLPKMAICLGCHSDGLIKGSGENRRRPTARCAACHLQKSDGRLELSFTSGALVPSGDLRGDDHGLDFRRDHRRVAVSDPGYCASCHTETWCQRCHTGVVKPLDLHGGDYISRHPQEARRNQPDCSSCHRQQSFCIGCHERLGVASHSTLPGSPSPSAFSPATPRRFHPEGWSSAIPGPNHHAYEAQRNVRACASCHREETCISCHSGLSDSRVAGGANPHPADWISSGRCRALSSRNARVCLKCHRDQSAALSCDRS